MAEFKPIPLPQDLKLVDEGGNVSGSWLGAVSKLANLPSALNAYAKSTGDAITDAKSTSAAADQALGTRISVLEANLQQEAIADLDTAPVLNVGAIYEQSEIVAIRDRLLAAETKLNAMLAALRAAAILSEE